jgi:hypothetical protein
VVSNLPSTPTEDDPPVFLPRKRFEWGVVLIATAIWWLLLFGVIPVPESIPIVIPIRGWARAGGVAVFLIFALFFGPPVLVMMVTRGIAWMLEQRAEAAEKAARQAKAATRKKSGAGVKFGK